eukprot:gene6289-6936_t
MIIELIDNLVVVEFSKFSYVTRHFSPLKMIPRSPLKDLQRKFSYVSDIVEVAVRERPPTTLQSHPSLIVISKFTTSESPMDAEQRDLHLHPADLLPLLHSSRLVRPLGIPQKKAQKGQEGLSLLR